MFKKGLYVFGAVILILFAVVIFFPVTGTADMSDELTTPFLKPIHNKLDSILDKLNNMSNKLDNMPTTTWTQKLPAAERFELVLDGAAVLDKETGLVWEKSPSSQAKNWDAAVGLCYILELGGRKGWRLPTIEQLASLVDTSQSSPALPAGHPFTGVLQGWPLYWSATTAAYDKTLALMVVFDTGYVGLYEKDYNFYSWCVRGGQGYDGQ
jgi:hypothetical protein